MLIKTNESISTSYGYGEEGKSAMRSFQREKIDVELRFSLALMLELTRARACLAFGLTKSLKSTLD